MTDTCTPPSTRPDWQTVRAYEDIRYERDGGLAKITICRPEVRNAFRPKTLFELIDAFTRAREDNSIGVILFTGEGDLAFCSGGDQRIRGNEGYVGDDGVPRLNVLDLQRLIRSLPKVVIAAVAGYAIGGGHVLHVVCDLTIAADNARFGQTGPRVGSFDGGFGSSYLARIVGQKKAREIWYLCEQYDAAGGARDGAREQGGAARRARGDGRGLGPAHPARTARSRSAASRPPSTPSSTGRRASRNWPATRPSSST